MKRLTLLILLLPATIFLSGMGDLGGAPAGMAPETEEDIQAVIIDRQGVRTEVSRFSMGGKTYLEGAWGEGQMLVEFRNLKGIEFREEHNGKILIVLSLRTGDKQELRIKKEALFHGATDIGSFRIRARSVRQIAFP
ncbi:hypothetical protein [Geoalkalibacter halelectricus]|uniref:Uncharacterized protein n=1 Tax=Geoalkalibacter halelectricus TaxID=2847045 RepID=A0ABY5ZSM8_9BACT|nr:hypothetical protein [Geoalkalibacter halelectricus]MDO3379145.1 hypothetical protein [Geoalkalibacter halelectricus]UWZ80905.1 hypothetical protein L9S41_05745 [Geoalkalibacter halelectricus]